MKSLNVLNRLGLYALFPILLLTTALTAEAAIYMNIEGIDGESRDATHENWIDVLSVSEGLAKPGGAATGSTRRRGSVVFEDIEVGKELDKSSPKIREAIARGQVYPLVEIEITKTCGGARVVYFRYELKNVLITSVSMNASGGDTIPVEEIALNFEEIKWTYTELDDTCSSKGNVEATWKVEEGES